MSSSARPDAPARSPDETRFFTRHYHVLKGLCYAPAGALLLLGVVGALLTRPQWLAADGVAGLACFAAVGLTAPWVWYMHRRYEAAYGRVREAKGQVGSPIGQWKPSFWAIGPLLLFGFCWIALTMAYIPEHTSLDDNHYFVIMPAWLLLLGALSAPATRLEWFYGAVGTLLFLATLLPLATANLVLVQALNYGLLGAVVLGVGLYNHRLLVDTLETIEVNIDE